MSDLKEVFNKTKLTMLPPHCSYDCTFDLLPGATRPSADCTSCWHQQAMEDYTNRVLNAGIIRPASLPAGAGFFYMGNGTVP